MSGSESQRTRNQCAIVPSGKLAKGYGHMTHSPARWPAITNRICNLIAAVIIT